MKKNIGAAGVLLFCLVFTGLVYSQESTRDTADSPSNETAEATLNENNQENVTSSADTAQSVAFEDDQSDTRDEIILGALEESEDPQNIAVVSEAEAQEVSASSETETPPKEEVRPPAQKVTKIEIKGNKYISQAVILSKIKTRAGSEYSTNVISDDIKRLNELGYFSDISIDTEDFEGGIKLIIIVTERPIIGKITVSGFERIIREEKLKETLKSKEGQYLDQVLLKEDINTLKDLCNKKGYANAEVTYKVDTNPETNKAALNISMDMGKRVRIKKIDIRGNKNFKTRRLLKLLKIRKAGFLSSGFYKEELLKDDIDRLISFYHREGYTDVRIDYETGYYAAKKGLMLISIRIEEGRKYLVGNVVIKNNTVFTSDEIKKALESVIPNKVFSQEGMREDISNIQGIYFDRGYIFTQVSESTYVNPETDRVDVTYSIEEGSVAYVDKVNIRGNIKTKDVVIRRELRIFPGDRFDGEKLKRSKERLQNLGFFEEVSYDIEESTSKKPDNKNLVVEVKESKTGEFSFGGGYSSVDKLIGFVEIAQKNFDWKNFPYFTGDGQDLRLRAELGSIAKNFELSFTEPWVFDYPVSFGFDAYRRVRDRETDVGYGYSEKRTGGDLRLGKELTEYLRGDAMYRIEEVNISSVSDDATNDLKKETGSNVISSLQLGLTKDTTDNVFNPSRGYILAGTLEAAGGPFGGDKDFGKFTSRASKYFNLFNSSVLEFRLRTGIVDAYGNSDEVPIYERFYAGGAYTIRGYHERKVGPIDSVSKDPIGGEAMAVGNIEYLYPIIDVIKAAVFYDVGNVWSKVSKFGSGGYKAGFGVGARIKTPIGPVRLDYGWPLNKEAGESVKGKGRFHFSLSHGF